MQLASRERRGDRETSCLLREYPVISTSTYEYVSDWPTAKVGFVQAAGSCDLALIPFGDDDWAGRGQLSTFGERPLRGAPINQSLGLSPLGRISYLRTRLSQRLASGL